MRKLFLSLCLLCLMGLPRAFADERHDVRLNNYGKNKETISILGAYDSEICRIEAVLAEVDDNGFYTIDLSIENLDDVYILYIFGNLYSKSQLRTQFDPSIFYSSGFKEEITQNSSLLFPRQQPYLRLYPGYKEFVTLQGKEGEGPFECTIPLYFAKPAGWLFKRHSLMDMRIESLNFIVDIQPLPAYVALKESVSQMLTSLSQVKFTECKHSKKHEPALEDQRAKIRGSLDSLARLVTVEMEKRTPGSKRYEEFKALRTSLQEFNVDQIQVEECKVTERLCSCPPRIAEMSLRQISYRMEELYLRIHNGESTKDQVIAEVRALKVHSGHIRRDPERLKSGINRYYERINSL